MNWYKLAQSEIKVYHGTKDDLNGFNKSKQKSGYYPGFYVTSSKDMASTFGNNIYTFMLQPSKYYEINGNDDAEGLKNIAREKGYWVTSGSGSEESRYLKDLGKHGIKRGVEYIVFEPEKNLRKIELSPEELLMQEIMK